MQEAAERRAFYIDSCLVIQRPLPFGKSWLYSPRPEIKAEEQFAEIDREIAKIARKGGVIFWKIEGVPELRITDKKQNRARSDGFFNSQYLIRDAQSLQYPETFVIDLSQTEDQLLKKMKQKTRYNIGLSQKRGITVRWSKNLEDIPLFYDLLRETANRQHIAIHPMNHYKSILSIFGRENAAALAFAYYQNKPIAANLVIFYGDTATYLHGGTDGEYHRLMSPYLLQWETMREAKQRGLRWYDLGGCAATKGRIKKWAGITRFKEGFGGELTAMGETYDVVFEREWYWLYKQGNRLKTLIN